MDVGKKDINSNQNDGLDRVYSNLTFSRPINEVHPINFGLFDSSLKYSANFVC